MRLYILSSTRLQNHLQQQHPTRPPIFCKLDAHATVPLYIADNMSFSKRAPSTAALARLSRAARAQALGPSRQARWLSTEKGNNPTEPVPNPNGPLQERSFKGQLYQSTAQRMKQEMAERERFADQRNESAGGRNTAIMFGMPPSTRRLDSVKDFLAVRQDRNFKLTFIRDRSYLFYSHWRILVRFFFTAQTLYGFHGPNKHHHTS